MLRCNACIGRTLSTVFADVLEPPYQPVLTAAPSHLSGRARPHYLRQPWHRPRYRSYATATTASLRTHEDFPEQAYSAMPVPVSKPSSRKPTNSHTGKTKEPEPSIYKQADLERELRWLRDPLKLADRVVTLLRENQYFKALALVRLASKDLLCTVSWNHLVDWNMSKGNVTSAVKVYNEMKKRAQIPDARTYTTLFRGFAWHVKDAPGVLEKALSIYHSMFHENAPVKPSIIHTNAVLKVCAFAGDMDALLGVAAKLPERGNGAPDTLTYTVILNAVRNSATNRIKNGDVRSGPEKGAVAVGQGRKLWEEIRGRWVKGDLFVDEELVCAMGRVLLLGGEADADDVLSLLEQTMGISRQVAKLGDPARYGFQDPGERHLGDFLEDGSSHLLPPRQSSPHSHSTPAHLPPLNNHAASKTPFAPIPNIPQKAFVRPSRNTLSIALEACTSMSLPCPAQDYWGLLTAPSPTGYDITPDAQNYHSYLRLLRLQRASKRAVELIDDIKEGRISLGQGGGKITLEPKLFRIAMSACTRDKNNPNAVAHASSLVKTMLASLEDIDAPTLTSYLELACSSRHSRDDWRRLMEVERVVMPAWRNLKSLVGYQTRDDFRDERSGKQAKEKMNLREREVLEVARGFIGLCDKILEVGREDVAREELKRVREEKARLGAWVQRRAGRRKREGPGAVVEVVDVEEGGGGGRDPAQRKMKEHTKSFSFRPRARELNEEIERNKGYELNEEDEGGEDEEEDDDDHNRALTRYHRSPPANRAFAPDPGPRNKTPYLPSYAVSTTQSPRWSARRRESLRQQTGLASDQEDDDDGWNDDSHRQLSGGTELRQPWNSALRSRRGGNYGAHHYPEDTFRSRERKFRSVGWGGDLGVGDGAESGFGGERARRLREAAEEVGEGNGGAVEGAGGRRYSGAGGRGGREGGGT